MSFLRFLMLLSLIVWVGGLIFFPAVAQTAFSVLPSRHLAGSVVGRSLGILHWMGIGFGVVFLASSLLYSRISAGGLSSTASVLAARSMENHCTPMARPGMRCAGASSGRRKVATI